MNDMTARGTENKTQADLLYSASKCSKGRSYPEVLEASKSAFPPSRQRGSANTTARSQTRSNPPRQLDHLLVLLLSGFMFLLRSAHDRPERAFRSQETAVCQDSISLQVTCIVRAHVAGQNVFPDGQKSWFSVVFHECAGLRTILQADYNITTFRFQSLHL